MSRKRKLASNWASECRSAIEAGDLDTVRNIKKQLETLESEAQGRLIRLQPGTGVCMIDSNQSQDQDLRYNMNVRDVSATFTAGPKAAKFSISFRNENVEGDETIVVESELFHYEHGECDRVDDTEILAFLQKAGLEDALPECTDVYGDPNERRRWVYGDVVCDAVECVVGKYGRKDSCGVGLGMGCEDIYSWLGLDY